jgi:phosphonate transport system substrate-binding protein
MKKILIAGALIAGVLSTGLAQQDRTGWPTELKFGVIPVEGSGDATQRYSNLVAYLQKTLGIPVKFYTGADYAAVIVAMGSKQVDIAEFGAASYIEAAQRANAEAFVKGNNISGGLGYNSVIITRANSGINSFADAKGKTFSFVDPKSTSGYLVPMVYFLKDLKTKPDAYFKQVIFAGSHESSILAVLNGKVDVGATNNLDLDRTVQKGLAKASDFKVLWTSKPIINGPTAWRKDLPDSLKAALKDAFLKYNDQQGLQQLGLKSYVAATDGEYDSIREVNEIKNQIQNQ